jgi:prepilin-type N-terminal cleavage/methylation domain-containing protein
MRNRRQLRAGFSLIELMIVIAVLTIVMGAIFNQVGKVQQRSAAEQTKLDMFQESREFMDQMSRDLHQAGYPSPRLFAPSALTLNASRPSSPYANDFHVAVGLTKIGPGDLWFEGDVDGTGNVSVVHYHLDSTGTNCPCLKRSQQQKVNGDPLTAQTTPVYQVEVQNVQNGSSSNPIFYAYAHGSSGTPLTLPLDYNANSSTIASIDTVKVVLTVQSNTPDPQTKLYPVTSLISTVKLNNCSAANTGQYMSCQ